VDNYAGSGKGFNGEPLVGVPASRWTSDVMIADQLIAQIRKESFTVDEAQCAKDRDVMNYTAAVASKAMAEMLAKNEPPPIVTPDQGGVLKE